MIKYNRNGEIINVRFFTSYHARLRKLATNEVVPINISVYPKDWFPDDYIGEKSLAPKGDMLQLDDMQYTSKFNAILKQLDFEVVIGRICKNAYDYKLAKGWVQREELVIALNCYEMPFQFCHRQLVAKFMSENLNVYVREWDEKTDELPKIEQMDMFSQMRK